MSHHRVIKSYVRREGRMTPSQKQGLTHWSQYGLSLHQGEIDFQNSFGNDYPVILEIGFGMGHSLVALAQQFPETNFIGIEVHRPGVGKLLSHCHKMQINNVRVYQDDAVHVLQQAIPDHALEKILIYFPDPWPKKRHHKRRLIQANFVALLQKKLKKGGEVYLVTDWEHYAFSMLEAFKFSIEFENQSKTHNFIERPAWRPMTKFEMRGKRLGHRVWDLCFKLKLS